MSCTDSDMLQKYMNDIPELRLQYHTEECWYSSDIIPKSGCFLLIIIVY